MIPVASKVPVKLPVWRRRLLLAAILAGFVALTGRAVYLQGSKREFLQQEGDARYSRNIKLAAHRGMILDRNGEPLAMSSPVETIWASPPDVKINEAQLKQLARLLGLDSKALQAKFANQKKDFVYIKRRISPELASSVMQLGIPGVFMQREYRRFYPGAEMMAHVVGFADIDENGKEGIELASNAMLSGKAGSRRVIKDRQGRIVEDLEAVKVPQDGKDVILSIDKKIQYLAYRELSRGVTENKALAGSIVVLDAKTGEVLAMANMPTYNPNSPVGTPAKLRNRAIVDMFEPGSTLKPFTVASAIEVGNVTPETMIQTSPGYMSIGPATIRDAHPQGLLSVAQVIQKSSNVGAAKMALGLDRKTMWNFYSQVGFGHITNIGFPGEARGRLRDFKTWRPIEQATMSYGHGISLTLLQLARAYTVFANEGEVKPVSMFKQLDMPVGEQVFSPATANSVKDMLELVVQPGGTAIKAQVPGYRVAGKTGTAHKPGVGGYEAHKYVSSFVGMAPASKPRLIVAVMVDEPSNGQYYGGSVAAPIFSRVMGESLRMLSVPQDMENNNVVIPTEAEPEIMEST